MSDVTPIYKVGTFIISISSRPSDIQSNGPIVATPSLSSGALNLSIQSGAVFSLNQPFLLYFDDRMKILAMRAVASEGCSPHAALYTGFSGSHGSASRY